jgi:hypothetical protein
MVRVWAITAINMDRNRSTHSWRCGGRLRIAPMPLGAGRSHARAFYVVLKTHPVDRRRLVKKLIEWRLALGRSVPPTGGTTRHMGRRFGWCEVIYRRPNWRELRVFEQPIYGDTIALVRAGYRAIGYRLTNRGQTILSQCQEHVWPY